MQKKPIAQPQNPPSNSVWQKTLKDQDRQEKMKKLTIWGGIILACIIGMAILVKLAGNSGPTTTLTENANLKTLSSKDIVVGKPDAKLTIYEYADFQCPACAAYNPIVNKLLQEYEGKVNLVYRFFPLKTIHKNSVIAGQAGYAAQKQGKFVEMKDMLFEKQKDWEAQSGDEVKVTFIAYAGEIGMDKTKFEADMNSSEANKAVLAGEAEATGLGLNSTPSFFIGKKSFTPQGYDAFKSAIDDELGSSSSSNNSNSRTETTTVKPTTQPLR